MSRAVLLVDDDEGILRAVGSLLRSWGFTVSAESSAERALRAMAEHSFDVAVTDLVMPGMSGLQFISRVRESDAPTPVVVLSGAGSVSGAVDAMRRGAFDFVEKPVRPHVLAAVLERLFDAKGVDADDEPAPDLSHEVDPTRAIVGQSEPVRHMLAMIKRVATTDARVLILGENGTGKELVANAIHEGSARASGPLVKLNCSAVAAQLLESELFGHERGAFTGADRRRKGRFERANGGTLFLDEVGDMPLDMQAKILRVLQEGQFERVGGTETITVDVRVIAATNKDLAQMVVLGEFRQDLFYRLNVVTIRPPPLRERRGDVPLLVRCLVQDDGLGLRFTTGAMRALSAYPFPGNVRELRNMLQRLAILSDSSLIDEAAVLSAFPSAPAATPVPLAAPVARPALWSLPPQSLEELEKERILQALAEVGGRRNLAAERLGMSRSTLWRRIKTLGLDQ